MEPIEVDVLLQRPVPVRIVWEDGTKEVVNLPRLGTEGLIPWLAEMTLERQSVSRAIVSKMRLPQIDAARAEKAISLNDRAVISDLVGPIQEPAGMRRCITLSLAMTDLDAAKQKIVADKIMGCAQVAAYVSKQLSTLFYLPGEAEQAHLEWDAAHKPKTKAAPPSPLADHASATEDSSDSELLTTSSV